MWFHSFFSRKKEWNLNCFHFFREMKSEIIFIFTLFEKWKVNWFLISLFSRSESEIKMPRDQDREVKLQNNSRETRLSQVTDNGTFYWLFMRYKSINQSMKAERMAEFMVENEFIDDGSQKAFLRGGVKKKKTGIFWLLVKKLSPPPPPPFLTTSVFSDKDFLTWPRPPLFD